MAFQKGKPKTGGRKKGVKNRTTAEIRQHIQTVIDAQYNKLESDLDSLSPFQRVMMVEKLTKYFLPALNKNDDTVNHSGEIKIIVEYNSDDEEGDGN